MVTDALTTYPRIHTLKVTRNTLRYIDEGAFNGINVLKKMYLSENDIVDLPSPFGPVTQTLEVLHLWSAFDSQGMNVPNPFFSVFFNIWDLRMGNNRLHNDLDNVLPPNVTYLHIGSSVNDIETFPNLAKQAPKIEMCIANDAGIDSIPGRHLNGVGNWETLYLDRNQLTSVPDLYDHPLTALKLAHNPLVCEKSLCWIRMWPRFKILILADNPTCASPSNFAGLSLMGISLVDLRCYMGKNAVQTRHAIIILNDQLSIVIDQLSSYLNNSCELIREWSAYRNPLVLSLCHFISFWVNERLLSWAVVTIHGFFLLLLDARFRHVFYDDKNEEFRLGWLEEGTLTEQDTWSPAFDWNVPEHVEQWLVVAVSCSTKQQGYVARWR